MRNVLVVLGANAGLVFGAMMVAQGATDKNGSSDYLSVYGGVFAVAIGLVLLIEGRAKR